MHLSTYVSRKADSLAPPAVVNDAALSSGSGQVRAAGGAPVHPKADRAGLIVRRGHTVRYGSTLGLVTGFTKSASGVTLAYVRFISGVIETRTCSSLLVVREVGLVRFAK